MSSDETGNARGFPYLIEQVLSGREIDGKYRLLRCIGRGGMGMVFEAQDLSLARTVALKLLTPHVPVRDEARWRFAREGRALARISHPGVVRIYEVGADEELEYIAMELLTGEDLATRIAREGRLAPSFVTRLALALCDALSAIHDAGVVHRDLKPRNLFLAREGGRDDVLKVLDFGIAKLESAEDATRTGELLGSLRYMAPEQLCGARHVDAASDLWAAGAVLYEALSGRPPYGAGTLAELLRASSCEVKPLAALCPDVPEVLAEAIMNALRLEPSARPASARALRASLLRTRSAVVHSAPRLRGRAPPWPWPLKLLCSAALFVPDAALEVARAPCPSCSSAARASASEGAAVPPARESYRRATIAQVEAASSPAPSAARASQAPLAAPRGRQRPSVPARARARRREPPGTELAPVSPAPSAIEAPRSASSDAHKAPALSRQEF